MTLTKDYNFKIEFDFREKEQPLNSFFECELSKLIENPHYFDDNIRIKYFNPFNNQRGIALMYCGLFSFYIKHFTETNEYYLMDYCSYIKYGKINKFFNMMLRKYKIRSIKNGE